MRKGEIFIISGPSGAGKTTLHKKLLADKKFGKRLVKSVSATTRVRRPGEKDGRDYFFLTKKQFLYKKRAGHFLEWKKVFDNYYATPHTKVKEILRSGKNVLLCIDVQGAKTVIRKYPEAVTIFILPPSWHALKDRLLGRASETKASLKLRLDISRREMREVKSYKYVVVNDQLTKGIKSLKSIFQKELGGIK